jgi:transcription-repair coupling factor (superfamily II helicase)
METGDAYRASGRLAGLTQLKDGGLVVASARAVCQSLPADIQSLKLEKGKAYSRERLLRELAASSLERTHRVEQPGEYSARGGIVDIYPFGLSEPVRVDFFGEEMESIRFFNEDTQLSDREIVSVEFPLAAMEGEQKISDILPESAWVALREPAEVTEEGWPDQYRALSTRPRLTLQSLPGDGTNFRTISLQRFSGVLTNIPTELDALSPNEVIVFCPTPGEADRLQELLQDAGVKHPVQIERGRRSCSTGTGCAGSR